MNNQHRTSDIINEFLGKILEIRLILQKFVGDAVNLNRLRINLTVRIKVALEIIIGKPAVDYLDCTYIDNTVSDVCRAVLTLTGGFCIEKNTSAVINLHLCNP